ncbi:MULTISPECIES: hypothetical protein [unclassified Microcoleus]|uniref:hypothetical protein n=1 Tax=unclassified Microcoleus TaxID=2642155 RepID=UPI002FD76DA7
MRISVSIVCRSEIRTGRSRCDRTSRVRNDLVMLDRPLPYPPLLLVRSALLDAKNNIIC